MPKVSFSKFGPTIITEDFSGFLYSLQDNVGRAPEIWHDLFLPLFSDSLFTNRLDHHLLWYYKDTAFYTHVIFMRFVWFSQSTTIISLNIKNVVSATAYCVLCEVRTGCEVTGCLCASHIWRKLHCARSQNGVGTNSKPTHSSGFKSRPIGRRYHIFWIT
jgi:hypothetical protein